MGTTKAKKKRAVKILAEPELATARLVVPATKVRRLVSQSIATDGVASFVRRMVAVRDELLDGRVETLLPVARQSRSRPFSELISIIAHAARGGRVEEAEETAFYAASYAYRNSIDYFSALLAYLNSFRRTRARRRRQDSHALSPEQRRR